MPFPLTSQAMGIKFMANGGELSDEDLYLDMLELGIARRPDPPPASLWEPAPTPVDYKHAFAPATQESQVSVTQAPPPPPAPIAPRPAPVAPQVTATNQMSDLRPAPVPAMQGGSAASNAVPILPNQGTAYVNPYAPSALPPVQEPSFAEKLLGVLTTPSRTSFGIGATPAQQQIMNSARQPAPVAAVTGIPGLTNVQQAAGDLGEEIGGFLGGVPLPRAGGMTGSRAAIPEGTARGAGRFIGESFVPTTALELALIAPGVDDLARRGASRYAEGLGRVGAGALPEGAVGRTVAPAAILRSEGSNIPRLASPTEGEGVVGIGGGTFKKGEKVTPATAAPTAGSGAVTPSGPAAGVARSAGNQAGGPPAMIRPEPTQDAMASAIPPPPAAATSMADQLAASLTNADAVKARALDVGRGKGLTRAETAPVAPPPAARAPYVEPPPAPTVADNWPAAKNIDELRAQLKQIGAKGNGQPPVEPPAPPRFSEGPVPPDKGAKQGGLEGIPQEPSGRGFLQSVTANLTDFLSAPQALMSTISPPLMRQGKSRLVTNPVQAAREFHTSLKAIVSDKNAEAIMKAANQQPWSSAEGAYRSNLGNVGYSFEDVGGFVRDWGPDAFQREPGFEGINRGDSALGKVVQKFAGPSERQAAVELNLHAQGWYNEAAQRLWDAGVRDIQQYKDLAATINHFQQVGGWKQATLNVGGVQTPVFFSTRAMSGRAQAAMDAVRALTTDPAGAVRAVATQGPLGAKAEKAGLIASHGPVGAKQEAARALVNLVGVNMSVMGAVAAAGAGTIVWTNGVPKLEIGPNKIDPWAGWGAQARLIIGLGKELEKAESVDEGIQGAASQVGRFARGQEAPIPGTVTAAVTRKDYKGDPYSITDRVRSGKIFGDLYTPFNVAAIIEAWEEDGIRGAAIAGSLGSLSEGVSTYRTPATRRNEAQDAWAKTQGAKAWNELTPAQKDKAPPNVRNLAQAAREASAGRGDPIATATLANQQDRTTAKYGTGGATTIDTQLINGEIDGPAAREGYDEIVKRLVVAANTRFSTPEVQEEIKRLDAKGDLTSAEKAQKDYYGIFDTPGVKDENGNLNFDKYQRVLDEWESKYPQYSKEDISPSKPLSSGHAELIEARKELRPYFDAPDKAYQYARDLAQPGTPLSILQQFETIDDFRTAVASRVRQLITAQNAKGGPQVSMGEADSFLASFEKDMGLTDMIDAYRAAVISVHPEYVQPLNKWYGVSQELIDLSNQIQGAGVR